jgi:hypothetical protein
MDEDTRWTDRIVSTSGDWSGNVYDFYFRVYQRIAQDIKVPFKMENGARIDDTPVHGALREALANCLVNADYYGSRVIVILRRRMELRFLTQVVFVLVWMRRKAEEFLTPEIPRLSKCST